MSGNKNAERYCKKPGMCGILIVADCCNLTVIIPESPHWFVKSFELGLECDESDFEVAPCEKVYREGYTF